MKRKVRCTYCRSNDTILFGRVKEKQRFYCKECDRTFTLDKKEKKDMHALKHEAFRLYTGDSEIHDGPLTSARKIAALIGVNRTYIARWLTQWKKYI